MAAGGLKLSVLVEQNWKLLWAEELIMNDDILDLIREREFNLVHQIESTGIKAVKKALKAYDESKWEK